MNCFVLRGAFCFFALALGFQIAISQAIARDFSQPPLVRVVFSPEHPIQGQPITAMIEALAPLSPSTSVTVLPQVTLDSGTTALTLYQPTSNLWIVQLGSFDQIQGHTLNVKVLIQNTQDAQAIQKQIVALDQEIANLRDSITAPGIDPNVKQTDEATLEQDKVQRSQLSAALVATSESIGTDTAHFFIAGDTSCSSGYPAIQAVSPNFGPSVGGSSLTITGCNLSGVNNVLIGGQAASISGAPTATSVSVTTPAVTAGAADVQVQVPTSGTAYKNAISRGAYYSIPSGVNMTPFVQLSFPTAPVVYPNGATITSSVTIDAGLPQPVYHWQFLSVPPGSAVSVASLTTAPATSLMFTPDQPGTYIVELTVTSASFASAPVYASVDFYEPDGLALNLPSTFAGFSTNAGVPQSTTFTLTNLSDVDTISISTLNVLDSGGNDTTTGTSPVFTIQDADGNPLSALPSLTPMETVTLKLFFNPAAGTAAGSSNYNLNVIGSVTNGLDAGQSPMAQQQFAATVVGSR